MLTQERLNEIKSKLAGLSPEEQQEKLKELLTPEELSSLQEQQCPFCLISGGKLDAFKVYEDDFFIAALDIHPASKGHVVLFPKDHIAILGVMDDGLVGSMFVIANRIGKAIFDGLNPEGTNIFVASGHLAGQNVDHVCVHIIPRYKEDKVGFGWEGLKIDKEELEEISKKIVVPKKEKVVEIAKEEVKEEVEDELKERCP